MRRTLIAFAGALVGAVTAPAAAQIASTGAIQGQVHGQDGRPVPSATVEVARTVVGFRREALADSAGHFRIGFLPPGDYRIGVRRIGYRPTVVENVTVEAGSVTRLTIRLEAVATRLDAIVVTAPALSIDRERTEFGTAVGARELALLPLPNDSRDLVRYAIGARPDQVWGGATAQANNYQLDGIAVNHPGSGGDLIQPGVTWIEEVQVRGIGAGAEHGNFQGGIVNLVTKSGTNRFEGGLRANAENHRLNGSNLVPGEVGSEVSGRVEFDGHIRGPLIKDRLFYALFGQVISRDLRVLNQVPELGGTFVPSPPAETDHRFLAKLNWQPGPRDALVASLSRFETTTDRFGQTGFKVPAATNRLDAGTWLGSLSWQRTFSSRSFLEVKVSALDGSDRREPYGSTTAPGVQLLNEIDPREYQNAAFSETRSPRNLAATAAWDLFVTTGTVEHHFKIGAELSSGRWSFFRERNGGVTWRPAIRDRPPAFDPALPSTWVFNGVITSTWGGDITLDSRVRNDAAYIQDYIRITPRLNLNPGIRLGRWAGDLIGTGGAFMPVVRTSALEPRIGLNYALTADGSLVAKAHWGLYHQSMFAGFFDRAAGSQVYRDEERWEYSGPAFTDPNTTLTLADRDRLANLGRFKKVQTVRLSETGLVTNYHQPYISQGVLGLEKTWGSRWKVEALYLRRRNEDMVSLVDRNAGSNYTMFYNVTVLDRFGRPFFLNGKPLALRQLAVSNEDIIYYWNLVKAGVLLGPYTPPGMTGAQLDALTYRPDNILTNVGDAVRRFDQLELRLQARYPSWWFDVGGSLTRLDGNLNTVVGADDYGGSSAGPYVRPNEGFEAFGRLANQARLEIKARLGGNLPARFRGSVFASYASGDHYTPTLTLSNLLYQFDAEALPGPQKDRLIPGFFFETTTGQRMFVQPRGSYTYPKQLTLDLHLEREFGLGRTSLVLAFDGFNLLGANAVTEVQTSYNGETDPFATGRLNAVRNRQAPRIVRIGTGVRF